MLTITLDTGTLKLMDALAILDGLEVDIASTTVTAREVEGTAWAAKVGQLPALQESWVLGESVLGAAVWGNEGDSDRFEQLLLLLSGRGFPKPGKRSTLTDGERHLLRDAAILSTHAREGRDLFVSDDTKAIGRPGSELRARLLSAFGIRAMTLAEFHDYADTLRPV